MTTLDQTVRVIQKVLRCAELSDEEEALWDTWTISAPVINNITIVDQDGDTFILHVKKAK